MHQKLACVQAITFWIGLAFSISLTAALIVLPQDQATNIPSFALPCAMLLPFIIGIIFIITAALLARAVNKSPIIWGIAPTILGAISFILAYSMLSTTAQNFSTTS